MSAIWSLLHDRKRSQRGSVLSGVLIITAFLAIIAGALMTELSTNFLLSRNLVSRVNTEATVSSAMDLALDQLQNYPLNSGCPTQAPVSLNGQSAAVTYASCAPIASSSPQFTRIAGSDQPFGVDGTHAQAAGLNDYVVGDSAGTVFDYRFGDSTTRWRLDLGGSVTGTPLVMADPMGGRFLDLVPLSGPGCSAATYCVDIEADSGSWSTPSRRCSMAATVAIVAQPGAGRSFTAFAFTADTNGTVNALDLATSTGICDVEQSSLVSGAAVGRVAVFPCIGCNRTTDEIYVLTTTAGSSQLYHLTYSSKGLNQVSPPLSLPWGNASGLAIESPNLPARLAITFAGGGIAVVQVGSNAMASVAASVVLPGSPLIADAPFWCSCPGSAGLIGAATQSGPQRGALYVLDPSLNTVASYAVPTPISTTPSTDGGGDWFVGGEDGKIYEAPAGQPNVIVVTRDGGVGGGVGSGVQVGSCAPAICIYFGSRQSAAYMVQLDARDAVLTACIVTCAGQGLGPRLWAQVEVDTASSPPTVHVQGWSYYSP